MEMELKAGTYSYVSNFLTSFLWGIKRFRLEQR